MASIRPLPETVRNSVRSGIILFDLTRVVEELVFNSLDARATKVSVFVSIGSCYIKVVDDGGGITRDGLELVGGRYATSKFLNLADMNATSGNFGFRGEALASISEVSLLEIVTRTYGRPNGYRKILKGCKCLYLGIDDDRKDVGTTVVVRDIFYNQPVRRKYMQSSPNKVLQSIKKCVMRLALVCPNISFKVVDIERENEIFCTHSGSSPLSLVTSGFGVEVTCSLSELEVENDVIKLSGYISGPCNTLNMKALQYVYVNSQFVCKGPIHKLLSQLAVRFEHLNSWPIDKEIKNRKRSRSQPCPAYILNLRCPRSLYDLTYEPSKTYVKFKDWAPILNFFEKAIKKFWEEGVTHGESSNQATYILQEDQRGKINPNIISEESDIIDEDISKFGNQNCKDCLDLFSPSSDKLTEDDRHQFNRADVRISLGYLHQGISLFEEQQRNYFLDSKFPSAESFFDNVSSSSHGRKFHGVDADTTSESFEGHLLYDCDRFGYDMELDGDFRKPFLKRCSTQEASILHEKALFVNAEHDSFWRKQNLGENYSSHKDLCTRPCLEDGKKWKISKDSDFLLREFDEENCLTPYTCSSATQIGRSGSNDRLLNSEWYSVFQEPSSQPTALGVYRTTDINDLGGESRYYKSVQHMEIFDDTENECNFSYNMSKNVNQNHCTSSFANTGFDFDDAVDCYEISDRSVDLVDFGDIYSIKKSDILDEKPDWLLPESCIKNCHRCNENKGKRGHSRHSTLENHGRSRRSFSAPPFPRSKRRWFSLNHPSEMMAERPSGQVSNDAFKHLEASDFKYPQQSADDLYEGTEDLSLDEFKTNVKQSSEVPGETQDINKTAIDELEIFNIQNSDPFKELILKEVQDSKDYGAKWRNCSSQTPVMKNDKLVDIQSQHSILDISSGLLHLAGDALIPKTINKKCLDDAIVLHQVDKKFIPVVAGRTLAIIDQHAADERIRLEDLRQKVLSGEAKAITYLDAEQELVLPEIGYQLLHSYSQQIKDWGWICNIHDQNSESFRRNLGILNRQQMPVTLIAVPCILGVNLNDVDLLEFLQQLADTDGSSTIPPSVIRILNSKACRGAIMFGDSLLPSECSLLVEELKHTSLCFQCAHGRPTTVPLVNLEALHNQITKLGLMNEPSNDKWHGLHRHKICVERAAQRLSSAMGS